MSTGPTLFLDGRVSLYAGDCLEIMAQLPENSVDSVCVDPPYHLQSIVKRFGNSNATDVEKNATNRKVAGQGTSPFSRGASGFMGKVWDGGNIAQRVETWELVLRVLKPGGYIMAFGSSRTYGRMAVAIEDAGFINQPMFGWIFGQGFPKAHKVHAEGWEGWRYGGQADKPALEPIYFGQKPFSEKTGTANVLRWGAGAVNIDGCRVEGAPEPTRFDAAKHHHDGWRMTATGAETAENASPLGRWPANLITDGSPEVLAAFPDAPGQQREVNDSFAPKVGTAVYGDYGPRPTVLPRDGGGSAARFFYTAKADVDDRIGSTHPTVKPVDLIQYLVRHITPPGGTVLDCFAGTGTTGEAAYREGFKAILIEREPEYQHDIAERMRLCLAGPDEKRREITKRKGETADAGPLFAE